MAQPGKHLAAALAESEERFRQLSAAMFDAVAIHDRGAIVEINDTFTQLFGCSRQEAIGRSALDFAAPEDRSLIAARVEQPTDEPVSARGLRRDGSTFRGEMRGCWVPFDGRRLRMVIIRDISARYEAGLEQRRRLTLERVHRAVLEMERVEDFDGVVRVLGQELDELGVAYEAVGLNTIDEAAGTLTAYAMVGERLSVQAVNELSHPSNQELLAYWHRGEVLERAPDAKLRELNQRYSKGNAFRYNPAVVIDVPFVEGTLVVGLGTRPGDNDDLVSLLQALCPLVSLGFARTRDMAERQHAEAALRQAHDELELRVQERTAELRHAVESLQREVAIRQMAEARLTDSLADKEVLLKEIHHRVKNNLQIISSLLSLQSGYVADEKVLGHIEDTRNRVMSMALIHESLYQSSDMKSVDLGDYVTTLTERLFESRGGVSARITSRLDVEPIELSIETAIPCGLILNELISNALQHAFPDGRCGTVGVSVKAAAEGGALLTVWDDGVGLAADIDVGRSRSLGLVLVETLVRQLHARCDVERDAGTRFVIRLPPSGSMPAAG